MLSHVPNLPARILDWDLQAADKAARTAEQHEADAQRAREGHTANHNVHHKVRPGIRLGAAACQNAFLPFK